MSELVNETNFVFKTISGYGGVCHDCGSPVSYEGFLVVALLKEEENEFWVLPFDKMLCPFCKSEVKIMHIYKSVNVTREFEEIKK